VNKARIASSNKTGIVFKISLVFFVLLGLLVYKLNDYFKADKVEAMQGQIRNRVVSVKTTVSGQLAQLKNVLSEYENEISDTNVNWVQLDPFFAIARVKNEGGQFQVLQLSVRSNTPAERWNADYLARALRINKSVGKQDISVQLFRDRENNKFIILRFKTYGNQELVVAGAADYFQKYFDIERGSRNKSLLITSENILAGHSEASYIASSSKESKLPVKSHIIEKEEIAGTNLMAISYILRSRITSGFAVPWSVIGVVVGVCFVLIGIIYWSLDPIERRVERYRKQEREQIYKDTVQSSLETLSSESLTSVKPQEIISDETKSPAVFPNSFTKPSDSSNQRIVLNESDANNEELNRFSVDVDKKFSNEELFKSFESVFPEEKHDAVKSDEPPFANADTVERFDPLSEQPVSGAAQEDFLTLDEEKIDLDEIEKALALDDFDSEDRIGNIQEESLKQNLQTQKISIDTATSPIERPQFALNKKEFKVDEFKVFVRRPERS
jgi:hypothetical protein